MSESKSVKPSGAEAAAVAKLLVDLAADIDARVLTEDGRDLAAVLLGRLGGLKGGRARADKLSAERRSEIAAKAAQERWSRRRNSGE